MQACYPDLWAKKIQPAIMDKLAGPGVKPSYRSGIMLSMLLGSDLTGSLGVMAQNQATHASPSRQRADQLAGPVKPTVNGMGKIDAAGRFATDMQRSQQRGRES